MGAVTIAAARPSLAMATAVSIASVTALVLPDEGFPGARAAAACVGMTAPTSVRPQLLKTEASPTSLIGCLPIRPPSILNAATAISGPMPAGSPIVTRIGASALARLAGFDIGAAPQVANIAPRQHRDLLVEKLLFDLLARGNCVGGDGWCPLVAPHHHLDTGGRHERRCG